MSESEGGAVTEKGESPVSYLGDRYAPEADWEKPDLPSAEDCPGCQASTEAGWGPKHDANERCQSGKRNHCSCDICF